VKNKISENIMVPITILFLLISPIPYLYANLNVSSSEKYTEYLIDVDRNRSRGTMVLLKNQYNNNGNTAKADSLDNLYPRYFPYVRQYADVMSILRQGKIREALQKAQAIKPDKFLKDYYNMWVSLYLIEGDYEKALSASKKAVQLQRYYSNSYIYLGMIYNRMNYYDSALSALQTGYNLNNRNIALISEMLYSLYNLQYYDSTIIHAHEILNINESNPDAFYWLAKSFQALKQDDSTYKYAERFRETGQNLPDYSNRLNEFNNWGN
ncbi:MAG: hypothetical protein ABIJ45_04040, partial [Candidatus Zixiibacteriota bacterium]